MSNSQMGELKIGSWGIKGSEWCIDVFSLKQWLSVSIDQLNSITVIEHLFTVVPHYFYLSTAILHSWIRLSQILIWLITSCVTHVNLPRKQLDRCQVRRQSWCIYKFFIYYFFFYKRAQKVCRNEICNILFYSLIIVLQGTTPSPPVFSWQLFCRECWNHKPGW